MKQLVLDLGAEPVHSLDTFQVGENAEMAHLMHQFAQRASREHFAYLWGDTGAGKTHLLQALAEFRELGDFGNYKHVFESSLGFEGFTTAEGANPTLGRVGEQTLSPTFVFTTYFDASLGDAAVERFMRRLVDIHPWEVPVIEVTGPVSVSSTALAPPAEASKTEAPMAEGAAAS